MGSPTSAVEFASLHPEALEDGGMMVRNFAVGGETKVVAFATPTPKVVSIAVLHPVEFFITEWELALPPSTEPVTRVSMTTLDVVGTRSSPLSGDRS